jgi:hypothetical protein
MRFQARGHRAFEVADLLLLCRSRLLCRLLLRLRIPLLLLAVPANSANYRADRCALARIAGNGADGGAPRGAARRAPDGTPRTLLGLYGCHLRVRGIHAGSCFGGAITCRFVLLLDRGGLIFLRKYV